MKDRLYKALGLLLIVCIGVGWAIVSDHFERMAKAERMDRRELHYDADGDFILIDTQEGLMGFYKSTEPVSHIWRDDLKTVKPGLYRLAICEEHIELTEENTDRVRVIPLRNKEMSLIREKIEDGIPVLAY